MIQLPRVYCFCGVVCCLLCVGVCVLCVLGVVFDCSLVRWFVGSMYCRYSSNSLIPFLSRLLEKFSVVIPVVSLHA